MGMKTTVVEKGRGDTRSEMWNQVLLGNGRVGECGGGSIPRHIPAFTSCTVTTHPQLSSWCHFCITPVPDYAFPIALSLKLHPLQFFPVPGVT